MENNKTKLKLSPPWAVFYREICMMFMDDPDVDIIYDEEAPAMRLMVKGASKADAIATLLPTEKAFGNVTLKVEVIPANGGETNADIFQRAFDGNPAFSFAREAAGGLPVCYVVFKPEIVQFFNDDLGDIHGICSTLYEDIARDLFEGREGVYFCTDLKEDDAPFGIEI